MTSSLRHRPYNGPPQLPARHLPQLHEVAAEPQLASLALIEIAVDIAILAMAAAYPKLLPSDRSESPELRAAFDLVAMLRCVGDSTAQYRLELRLAHDRTEDLPF